MAASTDSPESWYLALLGFAEHFRTSSPPKIRLCVHCLQAVIPFKPPLWFEAQTHLNSELVQTHPEKAVSYRPETRPAVCVSGAVFIHCTITGVSDTNVVFYYCLNSGSYLNKSLNLKTSSLKQQVSCQSFNVNRALFLLSKGMLLLMERKLSEVHPLLTLCGTIVENWQGNAIQKESLRVFFLVLQVTHYLDAGQVKSVKLCLKQLQQCIQTISTLHDDEILPSNPAALFHWLPKEHMCVLVYLVTVMHSMQADYLEKAQKYTDKALMQLEKLKMLDNRPILSTFQVILLEHIIMCRLVTGHKAAALQEESNNMVVPAMQLASKIPDMSVQLWSSALLKDLNKACGNTMDAHEAAQMHQNFSKQVPAGPHRSLQPPRAQSHQLDRRPPPRAVSASERTYNQPGQPALRASPQPGRGEGSTGAMAGKWHKKYI
ncbi:MAU2 chromatid cohesion factor homolog isoform X2 [Scomber scombrus]|uniref:Cohesin loading complex subunit SCC4 homolog n=1 Tax=Scomber scombrus TaxID=13677 RepID=A0AAV1N0M9_SCOSC